MTKPLGAFNDLSDPANRPGAGRAQKIAAIHALADWFVRHPEAPLPTYLTASHSVTPKDEVDEATRVAGVRSVAQGMALHEFEGDRTVQGDIYLMDLYDGDPMTILYRVSAHKDENSTKRYL